MHAILGKSSSRIATHPSDLAVALVALEAEIHLQSGSTDRLMTLQAVKHDVLSTISFSKVFVEAAAHRTSRLLYSLPTSRSVTRWSVGCGRPDFHARSRNAGGDCELGLQRDRKEGARVPDPAGKTAADRSWSADDQHGEELSRQKNFNRRKQRKQKMSPQPKTEPCLL
jgi:hypothetical protein